MTVAKGLVSVVIPTFNDERFVKQSIDCVLAQTYQNIEIIVVDDGSTDNTVRLARAACESARIIEQQNAGSAAARNRGMSAASGEYIAFLDADDYWLPNKLQLQMAQFERYPDCALVACAWREWRWPSIANPLDAIGPEPAQAGASDALDGDSSGWLYPKLLLDCTLQTSTVVLRKSLLREAGFFDETLRRGQDYDYWLRCSRLTAIRKLASVQALYRIREDSITKRVHDVNYGGVLLERAVARWGTRPPTNAGPDAPTVSGIKVRRRIGKVWRDFGVAHMGQGCKQTGVAALRRALRWWPLDLIAWRCLCKAMLQRPRGAIGSET